MYPGFSENCVSHRSEIAAHVRFGSKADICGPKPDVRFTPNLQMATDIAVA